ncbi:hypothetical protein KZZ52_33435 [Dactylosporangium sp. AC04546]|uniref:hypothetical protein n=1 Tax=Dactylosporangium sp. AC04546 TaxID=2862460 RepID=UPI001EDE9463|nr:hypothetical protein [Dactylosporangium sp. AC04546]WVK78882.1 hypothetical protein KZZ52_33435 [Dactylosporangium sp. AC04546]
MTDGQRGRAHRDQLALVLSGAYAALLDGDPSAASWPIAAVLRHLDREHAPADPVVIELAVLWAAIAADSDDAQADVVAWARWSVAAATEHYGRGHLATRRARLILARVLSTHGDHLAAAEQYRHLVEDYTALGEHDEALHLRAVRAAALHNGGRCYAAVHELKKVWRSCRAAATGADATAETSADVSVDVRGGGWDSAVAQYAGQLVAMLTACGRLEEVEVRSVVEPPAAPATGVPRLGPISHGLSERVADLGTAVDAGHALICERQRDDPLAMRLQPNRRRNWTDLLP